MIPSTLPWGRVKMVGVVKKSLFFSVGDDTILGEGQVKQFSSLLPHHFFPQAKNWCLPPSSIFSFLWGLAPSKTARLSRGASLPGSPVTGAPSFDLSECDPCRTCCLEVYTIFGTENPGSVHYFRDRKPFKCILLSELKTLEVYTIFGILFSELKTMEVHTFFGSENLGSVYYFQD